MVVYLTITKKDTIESPSDLHSGKRALTGPPGDARILVVANKSAATPALIDAVRERAAAGLASFFMLVPNPHHLAFDRIDQDVHDGEEGLSIALPVLREATGVEIDGAVASSPNAYDDIVDELGARHYDEIILETPPSHVSHWLHVDLPERIAHLGYPLTTIAATH